MKFVYILVILLILVISIKNKQNIQQYMNDQNNQDVHKSTPEFIEKLRELAVLNTEQIEAVMKGTKSSCIWTYIDKVTIFERQLVFKNSMVSNDGEVEFESKTIGALFKVVPSTKTIELDYFYYPKRTKEVKKNFPPYMTMYFLQAYADSVGYEIIIDQDVSRHSNSGASYYATNYGFSPPNPLRPTDDLTRNPCPEDLQDWINALCINSLEECFQNAAEDDMLDNLKESSCWSKTTDALVNFGSRKVRNRTNQGFRQMLFMGKLAYYRAK